MITIIIGNYSFSATESRESHDYNRLKIPQAHSKKYAQFDDIATSLGNVNFKVAIYTVHRCVCQVTEPRGGTISEAVQQQLVKDP